MTKLSLQPLRAVVAEPIPHATKVASQALTEAHVRHALIGVLGACGLVACTHLPQPQLYAGPRLAPTQVARLTHDDYAKILKVDEREVYGSEFEVLPGCHSVSVAYAVTFVKETGRGLGYRSWRTTTYQYDNPVLFAIDMKPFIVYWFKGTFGVGGGFNPEVVEQDEANRGFPPGVHCPSPQAPDTAR
jgi:hypothetical protein